MKKMDPLKIYIYTWNPNDPCFDWKRPCFWGLTFKNRGYLGSRYIYFILKMVIFYCRVSLPEGIWWELKGVSSMDIWFFGQPWCNLVIDDGEIQKAEKWLFLGGKHETHRGGSKLGPLDLHPQSLTWKLKMMVSKRNLLFQQILLRFHVKLQGCI